jgi:amino acid adenylation domain-containing protein
MGASKTTKKEVQLPWPCTEETYCAAWAVVLARHGGDGEAGEVEVSFGCGVGTAKDSLRTLNLSFSTDTEIGTFLGDVRKELETLPSADLVLEQFLPRLQPFASTLRIGGNATSSNATLETTVNITCTADAQNTIIRAHHQENAAESAHIDILLAHLEQAVLQIHTLPQTKRLREIDIFSSADTQLLHRWNHDPPPQVNETLCGLFARHVLRQPSAPAVCAWDRDLSYAELDSMSETLAGDLVRRGVGTEAVVALCVDKSALAVVVMMAVLRTGASFVHLGISTPTQRQAAILDACQAVLLVVDPSNAPCLIDHQAVTGLVVDSKFIAALPGLSTPLPTVEAHFAAAITFTSGSTGTPKGIVVEHGSIATSCDAMATRLDIGPHTRVLQFASYTFDASVGDIFYALARGACVCSPSEQERVDNLAAVARRLEVNWAFLTPSVLSLLEPRDIPSLRRLLLGGEPPSPKHVAMWAQSVSLHLVMGPAECAIYCAASDAIVPGQDPSTFGRAAGCRLWVVDPQDHTRLAPVGCPGELVVEGRTVARGYLNDPERTEQVFLDDAPWLSQFLTSASPRRLYKSGDLVRFHSDDGTFSFVARKDTQVKLHGQRVELGEIEHHLKNGIPDVDSAIALLNTSAEHTNRHPLIVQHAQGLTIPLTTHGTDMLLRVTSQLASVLPAYMIPTLFVPIHRVPFTLNGKRDVARLRQIAQALSQDELQAFSLSQEAAARPLNCQEEQLRKLWAQVLDLDASNLGPDSDFIRQGGDSLAAMRLGSLATEVGLHLPVFYTMAHPRLADMASKMSLLSSQSQERTPEPFSLLPNTLDVTEVKARSAALCNVDVDQIEDIYPSTPPASPSRTAADLYVSMGPNCTIRRDPSYKTGQRYSGRSAPGCGQRF